MANLYQVLSLLLVPHIASVSMELPEEAVLRADGKVVGAGTQRRPSVMRRHAEDSTFLPHGIEQSISFSEIGRTARERDMMDKFFQKMARPSLTRSSLFASRDATNHSRARKKRSKGGHGQSPSAPESVGDDLLWEEIKKGGLKQHPPPNFDWPKEWLGNEMELLQDDCTVLVGEDKGYSDYGTHSHSCAMCSRECTDQNKQQEVKGRWKFEPALSDEPAKAVHFYTKMENVDGLGCTNCLDWKDADTEEIGISHNYEIDFSATKETKDVPNFKSLVGSYISTGSGTEFAGKLFFLVRDTAPPKDIDNCKKNPPGRRYALQGATRYGELSYCQRFCTIPHHEGGCPCGFMDAVGCAVHVHVATGMLIKFSLREVAEDAMAPIQGEDGKPKPLSGQQWEAVATFGHDNTDYKIDAVIGRVVLTGNGEDEGIIDMKQNLHHKGCTPCDMFYSSIISVGPFISKPAGTHWVRAAMVDPPDLSEESCELFRVTAKTGHVLNFESGPGLWPMTQEESVLFTCANKPKGNQTR